MKCKYCGRDFARLQNKSLHEKYCKKNENIDENIDKKIKSKVCIHDYVLLDDRFGTHRQAISQGYNAYCIKCKELT
jgi:cytidylate kinase